MTPNQMGAPVMMGAALGIPGAMRTDFGGVMPQMFTFQPTWTANNGVTHLNITAVGPKTQ